MRLDLITNKGEVSNGVNTNDEFYTPIYAIEPIIKFLRPNSTIWCPFDTEESNYVKLLSQKGFAVIHTHIMDGGDFFDLNIECDYIISNPPYSMKYEVFKKLFEIGKPFAMLVGVVGLFESKKRFELFRDNKFEILYFDRRISYFRNYSDQKTSLNPPFSSVYICKDILPETILFEELNK